MSAFTAASALAVLICGLLPGSGRAQQALSGAWETEVTGKDSPPGTVHLRLRYRAGDPAGGTVRLSVRPGELEVPGRLRREAGTFTFEGALRDGRGAGRWTFAADPGLAELLERRGAGRPSPGQQFWLAVGGLGRDFLDELRAQGYADPGVPELVRAARHGVGAEYLREMGAQGYRFGSLGVLVRMYDHGVTPAYARGLAEAGYPALSARELRRLRDHGVTPEFARQANTGRPRPRSVEALIALRRGRS
ncbi:MAG TPA: hypothetical protein VGR37_17930 [Longimicrobiaceae bacterium]|nr:hypothetical protein [Longimicrobiaceae bacterium]